VGLKAHAFTGTAEVRRNEMSGSSAIARDCGYAAVARAQTGVSVPRHPTYPTYDASCQSRARSLGSSAAADSGCRLISRARLAMPAARVERDPSAPSGRSGCRCWSHRQLSKSIRLSSRERTRFLVASTLPELNRMCLLAFRSTSVQPVLFGANGEALDSTD
jgi:hypothetical protein